MLTNSIRSHLVHRQLYSVFLVRKSKIKFLKRFKCTLPEISDSAFDFPHVPVMVNETLKSLNLSENKVILDMTFGAGGHTKHILQYDSNTVVVGLDRDPMTNIYSRKIAEEYPERFLSLSGKFSELPLLLKYHEIPPESFDAVLFDVGVSSMQFNSPERGFMLSKNGPLDMRMDFSSDTLTAADILAHIDEPALYKILKSYGGEKKARIIARAIIECRYLLKSLHTTQDLAELVASVIGKDSVQYDKLGRVSHPATRTFQGLRIFINNEMNELDYGIRMAHHFLKMGGLMVAITFHSLEDTIFKRHILGIDLDSTPDTIGKGGRYIDRNSTLNLSKDELYDILKRPWQSLTKHVVLPSSNEVEKNPRARSAKLRVAAKVA